MSTATRNQIGGTENGGDQSAVDMWSPSKIRRPVSMYERNLSTKSIGVNGKSSPHTDVSTMRHALKRYQSHLFELKEAKPTPPVEVPPVKVFVRPETPETPISSVEPATLSIESTETVETFPAPIQAPTPVPVELSAINHIPAYLSDPASTLLMTAALNALTQAQIQNIQTQPRNGQSTVDPMAAALAAASAQIIAATLSRPAAVAPVTPPVEASPPLPPTPPPAPVIIHMNSVSTETDIERPPSPVMSKELHDRMRRSGMTQLSSSSGPSGRPGSAQASFSVSSGSVDQGRYGGYTSSGSYPHSPYGQSHSRQSPHYRQDHSLRPALPTSNSFELPPSRTVSSSSTTTLYKNNQEATLPVQLKKPQSSLVRVASPPLPLSPQVSSLSLAATTGRSVSIEGITGITGIASASAGSPLNTGRKAVDTASQNNNNTDASALPATTTTTTAALPKSDNNNNNNNNITNINNCSSNSFAHWPDLPAADLAAPTNQPTTNNNSPLKNLQSIDNDYSLLKSNMSVSSAGSARSNRNLTFLDTKNTPRDTATVLEKEQGAERAAFSPSPNSLNESYLPSPALLSPTYKDFHAKYTNGLQAVEAVKSELFHARAEPSRAEKDEQKEKDGKDQVLTAHSFSTTSADGSELDDNSRANTSPSANSSPKNNTTVTPGSQKTSRTLSRRDKTSTTPNKNYNNNGNSTNTNQHTNKESSLPSPSTHPERSMMDTLLQQTSFLTHRQEMQAQYKAPERVYMKQFHSVDPRVFEVEFEGNLAVSAQPRTPTRAQYRNSIMELIVATPDFVTRPSVTDDMDGLEADLERAAFNASFMQSQRVQNNESSNSSDYSDNSENDEESDYDGSVLESQNEESKVDSVSDLDVQSVRTLQSVHTVHTVHTVHSVQTVHTNESSVPGVHPAQVNGCMLHKLLGTHSDYNLPVESTSRKSNKLTTTVGTTNATTDAPSATDNTTVGSTADISNFSHAIRSEHDTNDDNVFTTSKKDKYDLTLVDDDSIHSHPLIVDTPIRSKSTRSRKLTTNPSKIHSVKNVNYVNNNSSVLNPPMLLHTNSTRSVHRSFKYDDGMKKHILGRQTTSIKGQNKLHESALDFKQEACLNSIDAKNLKLASVTNRNVLVGWQVLILKKGELSLLGLAVITGVRTNMFLQTEYRISSDVSLDCWVRLKRGKGMGGTEFQPLRKVLTTKQCNTKMRVIEYKKVI